MRSGPGLRDRGQRTVDTVAVGSVDRDQINAVQFDLQTRDRAFAGDVLVVERGQRGAVLTPGGREVLAQDFKPRLWTRMADGALWLHEVEVSRSSMMNEFRQSLPETWKV